ncbi:MAG: hypothetical protein AAF823_07690, partial [Planctomycetota bacterium]
MIGTGDEPLKLVVFSDDWGRHPSSCQHLVRHLLERGAASEVVWVNTIGTRRVRLSWGDVKRGVGKVRSMWEGGGGRVEGAEGVLPRVVSPWMWPGFRSGWQRRLNARRMVGAVREAVGV